MMRDQGGKERLNNNEFRELIPHLPLADLLRIEYRTDKWYKLITISDPVKKLYGCTLCTIASSSQKNLVAHMEGKKHKSNIQDVKQLFHPEYTYMKQDWKLAVGAQASVKTANQKAKNNDSGMAEKDKKNKDLPSNATAAAKLKPATAKPAVLPIKTAAVPTKPTPTPAKASSSKPVISISTPNVNKSTATNKPSNKVTTGNQSTGQKTANVPAKSQPQLKVATTNTTAASTSVNNKAASTIATNSASIKKDSSRNVKMIPNTSVLPSNKECENPPAVKVTTHCTSKIAVSKASTPAKVTKVNKTAVTKGQLTAVAIPKTDNPPNDSIITNTEGSQNNATKITRDTGKPIKCEPNANDPIWNPKVSIKNLNVAKITKAAASISNDMKTTAKESASKAMAAYKIPLKKTQINPKCSNASVELTSKAIVAASSPVASNQIAHVEEASRNTNNCQQESGVASEDVVMVEDCLHAQSGEQKKITSDDLVGNSEIQNKEAHDRTVTTKKSKSAGNDSSNFSGDVQFDEISVKFDRPSNETDGNLVKNPFALNQDATKGRLSKISCVAVEKLINPVPTVEKSIEQEISAEVIVIDDDLPTAKETDSTPSTRKIPIIERHSAKPQRQKVRQAAQEKTNIVNSSSTLQEKSTNKRNATINDEPTEALKKKQKIVMNPAAAFLSEATSNEIEKNSQSISPNKVQYQTDRIVIPTAHKSKQDTMPKIATKQMDFSTKTFSSKPKDDDIHGLIGVEYVVKIMKSKDDVAPRYECSLCELVLDGPSMQHHLVAYNHRLKFCEKHFPTALRHYRQYIRVPAHETYKVMTPILAKLAVAIEEHHGRDLPYEVLERDYNINRHEILSKVFSCRHASEQYGPSFTHVLDAKEIDVIIQQKDNFKPQAGPSRQIFNVRAGGGAAIPIRRERRRLHDDIKGQQSQSIVAQPPRSHPYSGVSNYKHSGTSNYNASFIAPVDDETHKKMVADFLRGTAHQSGSFGGRHRDIREHERRARRSRSREYTRRRSRSRSNTRRELRKSISPLREGDIWQAYRHLVDRKVADLNEAFKLYRSDPETHPMYNDEWQKFWKRRKDELISAGLDHRSYNYQPEWVRFFKVRIEELYSQALENIKLQSRERLCLPMTNNNLADSKYHVQVQNAYPGVPATPEIESGESSNAAIVPCIKKLRKTDVIGVLRLMTALEEHLGSLGPKIVDLLSKALLIEKTNPDDINDYILTIDNCTLLETAMEKLKGVLFAGLLEGTKERAFKKVISDTEALLIFVEEQRKRRPPKAMPQNLAISNKPMYGLAVPAPTQTLSQAPIMSNMQSQQTSLKALNAVNQLDKKELAAKLAATLTAQGKTDFSPEQLEQLISVYTVIEKKKREAASASSSSTSLSNRKTLSDTLADFMNPSNPNSTNITANNIPDNSSNKQSYTAAAINRYLEIMRRMGGSLPNNAAGNKNINEIWQNLQNIQRNMDSNTDVSRKMETNLNTGMSNFGYGTASSSFGQNSQFGVSSITNKESLNRGYNPNSGNNLNTLTGGIVGSQQQNSYLSNTIPLNFPTRYNTGGDSFANTSNNSRLNNSNIGIYPNQQRQDIASQQNRSLQSFQEKNPNSNWIAGGGNWQNQRGFGGEGGGPRRNTGGGTGGGGMATWRNN